MSIRYLTAGESHGKALVTIVDGMPSGVELSAAFIDADLARRQGGYGRGGRQKIEKDRVEILSGVRHGLTLGSPIALKITNRDWENWKTVMSAEPVKSGFDAVTRPRPGHADLTGAIKYSTHDVRDILERSSARETAARVAAGACAKALLKGFDIDVASLVVSIGDVKWKGRGGDIRTLFAAAEASEVRCPDKAASARMMRRIDLARKNGDSLGGIFEVAAFGVPPGLGSHTQWDRKLDGRLAMAFMSIQAIKGVEVGLGFDAADTPGSRVHDEIFFGNAAGCARSGFWPVKKRFYRKTNNSGGIEGGMTNGEPVIIRAAMKPIPTLYKPLRSVDMVTKRPFKATVERSDICAVPAASIIGEAVAAIELAVAFTEKFGSDSTVEIRDNYRSYLRRIAGF